MSRTFSQQRPEIIRGYALPFLILVGGLALSAALAGWFFHEGRLADQERFDRTVRRLLDHLDERTERYALELQRFTDAVSTYPQITPGVWRYEIDRLGPKGNLPALVELAYGHHPGLRPLSEVVEMAENPIVNRHGHNVLPPVKPLPLMITCQWTTDFILDPENTAAWLKDTNVYPLWSGSRTGAMRSSPKRLVLKANNTKSAAVSYFFPVFEKDLIRLTEQYPEVRYRHFMDHRFKGLVIATLDWNAFLDTALGGDRALVGFDAFADTSATAATWMGEGSQEQCKSLEPGFTAPFTRSVEWPFFHRRWNLVFYSTPEFAALSPAYRGWVALGAGSALSLLMAGLVQVQINARRRQENISLQLKSALDELSQARRERERLNHDLHDGTIQSLYALQLGLSRSVEMSAQHSPTLGHRMEDHRRALTSVIGELRGFILRHEADTGPSGDLAGVLEALIQRLRLSTDKSLRTEISPEAARRLEGEQAVHLANLTREALSNSLRHAQASTILVRLSAQENSTLLEVIDNGCGFDTAQPAQDGLGLGTMTARAAQAGAEIEILSAPGKGTTVRVSVPLHAEECCG